VGFGGSVGRDVRAASSSVEARNPFLFYLREAGVRNGDSDLDSPEVCGPRGRPIGPGRVWIRGDEVSCR